MGSRCCYRSPHPGVPQRPWPVMLVYLREVSRRFLPVLKRDDGGGGDRIGTSPCHDPAPSCRASPPEREIGAGECRPWRPYGKRQMPPWFMRTVPRHKRESPTSELMRLCEYAQIRVSEVRELNRLSVARIVTYPDLHASLKPPPRRECKNYFQKK